MGKLEQEPCLRGGGGGGGVGQDLKQGSRYITNRYIKTKSSSFNLSCFGIETEGRPIPYGNLSYDVK